MFNFIGYIPNMFSKTSYLETSKGFAEGNRLMLIKLLSVQ